MTGRVHHRIPMSWLFIIAALMIITGASFSILRDPETVDYCRTIIRDGRKDEAAKNFMAMYTAGLIIMGIGAVLFLVAIVSRAFVE